MNGVPLGEARPSGLMGLLKRPADSGCLAALGAEPPISGLTEALFVSNRAKGIRGGTGAGAFERDAELWN